jgi:hypothetical protein
MSGTLKKPFTQGHIMPIKGQPNKSRGLARPNAWVTGPDPLRHRRYRRYKLAQCQANNFAYNKAGDLVSPDQLWQVTFDQWEHLIQSDPDGDRKYVCRRDRSQCWRIDNMLLLTRSEMASRKKSHRRPYVPEEVQRYFHRIGQQRREQTRSRNLATHIGAKPGEVT